LKGEHFVELLTRDDPRFDQQLPKPDARLCHASFSVT